MTTATKAIQVVLTAGPHDIPRAMFALELALASVVSGVETAVFLTLDATLWACEPKRNTGARVYDLLTQLDGLGVPITCCSTCAVHRCGTPEAPTAAGTTCAVAPAANTRFGIALQGLTTLIERIAAGVPTVTF